MSWPRIVNSFVKIDKERFRQFQKFGGNQFRSMTSERAFAILAEAVGGVAKAVLEGTNVEEEIIHVAAVAARWLDECYPQ